LEEKPLAAIHPFRALRPEPDKVTCVASVPYDVVNTQEARELSMNNTLSFLHVSRPEIGLPDGTDIYSDVVYATGVENFEKLKRDCPLVTEENPSLYLYRLIMGEQEQIGLVGCVSVDEYDNDLIKKHERTRPDKEDDRTRHMIALGAQTGPLFLTYRGNRVIDTMVMEVTMGAALFDLVAPDGIQHTVWHVPDPVRFVEAFRHVPALYIADGHHRAASASRVRAVMREKNPNHTGDEEYNFFLAVIFPEEQLRILPYNRVVKDLNGLSQAEFVAAVSKAFEVSENAAPSPTARGNWSMYVGGSWYGLSRTEAEEADDPIASLDVSVLQHYLLDPILGIKDVRTDKRIEFVGGIRGTTELEKLVDSGQFAVAFSMYATTLDDLLRVSDAGGIMPPKSTWFEPKLRDGLLIHVI
jgi:uncharacterized protein (DUF1015 family)